MSFKSVTYNNHWSLLNATGDRIAQLFNIGGDDLIGAWRWRVWLDHRIHEGSASPALRLGRPVRGCWLNISKRK